LALHLSCKPLRSVCADAVDLGLEVGDGGLAALFPDGEDGEHLRQRMGAEVAQGCDGCNVNGRWSGGWGKAGVKEASVDR
jgi:hypothetical protein